MTFTGARRHQCLYKRVPIGTATGLESRIARNRDIRRNPLHWWAEIWLGAVSVGQKEKSAAEAAPEGYW